MIRKLAFAALYLALAFVPPVMATELSPLIGIYNRDNVTLDAGLLTYPNATFHPMGVLNSMTGATAGATGTGEQTIYTYSVPANALDASGRRLRIFTSFLHAANGNACTFKQYFGSEVISSGSNTTSGATGVFTTEVVKTGASTQQATQFGYFGTTNIAVVQTAATETDTAAIVVKATVTGGTTGADCTVLDSYVAYMN